MNISMILGAIIVWGVTFVAGYGYGHKAGANSVISSQVLINDSITKTREASQQGAAQAIAENKPVNTTIVQKVQREIRENTVYATCRVPADGLQLANQAITGKPAEPARGDKLPATQPAK